MQEDWLDWWISFLWRWVAVDQRIISHGLKPIHMFLHTLVAAPWDLIVNGTVLLRLSNFWKNVTQWRYLVFCFVLFLLQESSVSYVSRAKSAWYCPKLLNVPDGINPEKWKMACSHKCVILSLFRGRVHMLHPCRDQRCEQQWRCVCAGGRRRDLHLQRGLQAGWSSADHLWSRGPVAASAPSVPPRSGENSVAW